MKDKMKPPAQNPLFYRGNFIACPTPQVRQSSTLAAEASWDYVSWLTSCEEAQRNVVILLIFSRNKLGRFAAGAAVSDVVP